MKALLIIFLSLVALGVVASVIVLMRMGISSRELWEIKNKLENENKNL